MPHKAAIAPMSIHMLMQFQILLMSGGEQKKNVITTGAYPWWDGDGSRVDRIQERFAAV